MGLFGNNKKKLCLACGEKTGFMRGGLEIEGGLAVQRLHLVRGSSLRLQMTRTSSHAADQSVTRNDSQ